MSCSLKTIIIFSTSWRSCQNFAVRCIVTKLLTVLTLTVQAHSFWRPFYVGNKGNVWQRGEQIIYLAILLILKKWFSKYHTWSLLSGISKSSHSQQLIFDILKLPWYVEVSIFTQDVEPFLSVFTEHGCGRHWKNFN